MTLVDSLDSVLMLYAYAAPSSSTIEGKIAFFAPAEPSLDPSPLSAALASSVPVTTNSTTVPSEDERDKDAPQPTPAMIEDGRHIEALHEHPARQVVQGKANIMSTLSILLTLLSIIVALRYAAQTRYMNLA